MTSMSSHSSEGRLSDQHAVISYSTDRTLAQLDAAAVQEAIATVPHGVAANSLDRSSVQADEHGVVDHDAGSPLPLAVSPPPAPAVMPRWLEPDQSYLAFNEPARKAFARVEPVQTTLHFTFGSSIMMDFVKNWLHFIRKADLAPLLVGAADASLLEFCNKEGVPAAAINPELDVWTYRKKPATDKVYTMHAQWKYFRHHVRWRVSIPRALGSSPALPTTLVPLANTLISPELLRSRLTLVGLRLPRDGADQGGLPLGAALDALLGTHLRSRRRVA